MWYLIGMLISIVVIICLPFIRFRSYWDRALKYPKAQHNEALDMLQTHIVLSFFEWDFITFEKYLERVVTYPTPTDMGDVLLLIFGIIAIVSLWIVTVPLLLTALLITKSVYFMRTAVEKKIEKNFQDK